VLIFTTPYICHCILGHFENLICIKKITNVTTYTRGNSLKLNICHTVFARVSHFSLTVYQLFLVLNVDSSYVISADFLVEFRCKILDFILTISKYVIII